MRLSGHNLIFMNLERKSGFTLIEIVIVIFILGVVAAMTVPGYMQNRERVELRDGLQRFVQILNEARNMAVSGLAVPGNQGDVGEALSAEETVLPSSFGVWLSLGDEQEAKRVVVFADLDEEGEDGFGIFNASDILMEESEGTGVYEGEMVFNFEGATYLQKLYGVGGTDYDEVYVLYSLPEGKMTIKVPSGVEDNWTELDWVGVEIGVGYYGDEDEEQYDAEKEAYPMKFRRVVISKASNFAYICDLDDISEECNF